MSEVATTNVQRYGIGSCSKTKATLAECLSCSETPPDGRKHGWIWKRISAHLCNIRLGQKGGVAVGSSGVVRPVNSGISHVCSLKCGPDASGRFKCSMLCPSPGGAGMSGWSGFGETGTGTTPTTGFKLCATPYYEIPKIALFGAGAVALFAMSGQASPMKKTVFDAALYAGGLAFAASLIGCITFK